MMQILWNILDYLNFNKYSSQCIKYFSDKNKNTYMVNELKHMFFFI